MDSAGILLVGTGVLRTCRKCRVIICAFGFEVGVAGDSVQTFYFLTFIGWERREIFVVVVGMTPDGAGRRLSGVDEKLMVTFCVVLTDPARRKSARFVFHRTAALGRNTTSGFVGMVGSGTLGVGWWWFVDIRHCDVM